MNNNNSKNAVLMNAGSNALMDKIRKNSNYRTEIHEKSLKRTEPDDRITSKEEYGESFSATVKDVSLRKERIKSSLKAKIPSRGQEPSENIELPSSPIRGDSVNAVTVTLANNKAFAKNPFEIDKSASKRNRKVVWGASLFFDDENKAEFPRRYHLCWNSEHSLNLPHPASDSSKMNSDNFARADGKHDMLNNFSNLLVSRSNYSQMKELEPLSEERKSKYFGDNAKQGFYETYKDIHHISQYVIDGLSGVKSIAQTRLAPTLNFESSIITEVLSPKTYIESSFSHPKIFTDSVFSEKSSIDVIKRKSQFSSHDSLNRSLQLPFSESESRLKLFEESFDDIEPSEMSNEKSLYNISRNLDSPRPTFLLGCLERQLPPRSLALLRNKLSTTLDLSHLGIGDEQIILLSKAVANLPILESISLKDNNLSDRGLEVIIKALSDHSGIVELNLSSNKFGRNSARALGQYLLKPTCPLVALRLSEDFIEDSECAMIVESLKKNTTLKDLDLSNNQLGKDESLNSLFPSTYSGARSLANLLRNSQCKLKKLNVHWNMIRMGGAVDFCDSIRSTTTLIHLNLSYNAIGREASTVLGSSLHENTCLEELIISNNSIDSIGCFTIVVGAREHSSLKFIDLDGNPIGEQGGRMLMKLAKYHGWRIRFSAFRCDVNVHSSDVIFKTHEPIGSYHLDLSKPYHRAVAYEILDVVALDPTLGFKYFDIKESGSKSFRPLKLIKFRQQVTPPNDVSASDLKLLKAIAAISDDSDLIAKVFKHFDRDSSGELDKKEFRFLLLKLGLDTSEDKVKAIMSTLDVDGEDLINFDETKNYLWNIGRAAKAQIREMETFPSLSAVEANPPRRYNLPQHGDIKLEIQESLHITDERGCLTKQQCQWIMTAADHSSNPALLLQYAMDLSTLYLDEAETLYKYLTAYENVDVVILSKIVPRMATNMDALSLVKIHFGTKTRQNRHLKKALGMAYNPLLGMYNGFYVLDLINEYDRICLHKLLEQSVKNSYLRQSAKQGDTSQNGNWSSFRNVRRDGKLIPTLQHDQFSPIPKFGILEFDFVDIARPNSEIDIPIEENKFIHIVRSCSLVRTSIQMKWIKKRLRETSVQRASLGESHAMNAVWMADAGRMVNTFDHLNRMYKSIDHRYASYEKSFRKEVYTEKNIDNIEETNDDEFMINPINDHVVSFIDESITNIPEDEIKVDDEESTLSRTNDSQKRFVPKQLSTLSIIRSHGPVTSFPSISTSTNNYANKSFKSESFRIKSDGSNSPMSTLKSTIKSPKSRTSKLSNHEQYDSFLDYIDASSYSFHKQHSSSKHDILQAYTPTTPKVNVSSNAETLRFDSIMTDPKAPNEFKSSLILHYLFTHLSNRYFTSGQMTILLELFFVGIVPKTIFGSYRVELLVSLFSRIIDLHNFHLILRVLTSEEHAAIIARLGWLNILNPCRIEGVYRLDLSRWEERQVAKMLIHLGIIEQGQNWFDESYTFVNQTDPMPGWVLTVVWYNDQGFPKQGILQVRYGDTQIRPDLPLRRMLLNHVLVSNEDIVLDLNCIHDLPQTRQRRISSRHSTSDITSRFSNQSNISEYKEMIQKQLKLTPDNMRYSLNDSVVHLAQKTPLTWGYFGTISDKKNFQSPRKNTKQSKK